jgi:lipopolysaccharide transport system ATP-binding protein
MSSHSAIEVEHLSKQYIIGEKQVGASSFREALVSAVATPFRNLRRIVGHVDAASSFWALDDVSLKIEKGEAVGIIGRNGAGKSTLLKILSRVTAPTRGRVELHGRVASLLEVGTGFHLELTGRENIFLNGAILGMSRAEIVSKLDEIIAFSGMEKFLDTPAKRYSSGMLVRLAFAVAAHLESEILLVDEVLAVGDAEFQRKCLGKMDSVAKDGRTIVFVSHSMGVVSGLCRKAIWIDNGRVREIGLSHEVIGKYMSESLGPEAGSPRQYQEDSAKPFQLLSAQAVDMTGTACQAFSCDDPVVIECACIVREPVPGLYGYMAISRPDGTTVMVSDSFDAQNNPLDGAATGRRRLRITVPARTLASGDYFVLLNFTSHRSKTGFNVDSPGIVARFHVDDYTTRRGNSRDGFFSTQLAWTFDSVAQDSGGGGARPPPSAQISR